MTYATPSSGDNQASTRSRLPLLLGLLAALSALLGLLLLTLGLVGVLSVATPNMQGFNSGQSVVISDGGMSVYSRSDIRSETVCTGEASDGQVVFERPVEEYAVDVTGSEFYEIARSPDDLTSGTYTMTCAGTSEAVYAGPWAPDTTTSGVMGPAGLVLGLLLLALAVALAIVALILRRRRPSPAAPGHPSHDPHQHGGQPGWQGSSAYSSPYATPSQPGPAYGAPPAQDHAPDAERYPYGAPPPPPPGASSYGNESYRSEADQQPCGRRQPYPEQQHPDGDGWPRQQPPDSGDADTDPAPDRPHPPAQPSDDDWPPPPPR